MLTREEKSLVRFHPAGTRGRDHQKPCGVPDSGKPLFRFRTLFSNLVKVYYYRSFYIQIWFLKFFLGFSDAFSRKKAFPSTFLEVFSRNFQRLKACIQNALFFHCPKCITQKDEKTCKKGVDRMHWSWYYIQVVAIRQQNKSQNRKTWTLKTEHKPRKSECAGRAFYNARPSQITSF